MRDRRRGLLTASRAVLTASSHCCLRCHCPPDWCVNRGQLSADWVLSLKSVQAKVKSALANPALAIPLDVQRHMEEEGQSDQRRPQSVVNQVSALSGRMRG